MAKIHLSRLIKQFDFSPQEVTGLNYRRLMQDILANQSLNVGRATGRISKDNYEKQLKRVRSREREKVVLADVEEVLPKRSVFINKAAQSGNLISDTLRDRLTGDLRKALNEFRTVTGEPAFERRRGAKAGTINPKLIAQFEKSIVGTYRTYTRRDPDIGVPANVHGIAVTEIRSTVNSIKAEYNRTFARKNQDSIRMTKEWRQNRAQAIDPRRGHTAVDGKRISIEELFQVPRFKGGIFIENTPMSHPHDPTAPEDQVINCNCDIVYKAILI